MFYNSTCAGWWLPFVVQHCGHHLHHWRWKWPRPGAYCPPSWHWNSRKPRSRDRVHCVGFWYGCWQQWSCHLSHSWWVLENQHSLWVLTSDAGGLVSLIVSVVFPTKSTPRENCCSPAPGLLPLHTATLGSPNSLRSWKLFWIWFYANMRANTDRADGFSLYLFIYDNLVYCLHIELIIPPISCHNYLEWSKFLF